MILQKMKETSQPFHSSVQRFGGLSKWLAWLIRNMLGVSSNSTERPFIHSSSFVGRFSLV